MVFIKSVFQKIFQHKFWWVFLLLAMLLVNFLADTFYIKTDLTAEKRYSLSDASKKVLQNLKQPITIDVLLEGEFPAGFKRIANTTKEFLDECKRYSKGKLSFTFIDPFGKKTEEQKQGLLFKMDSMYGLKPTMVGGEMQSKIGENVNSKLILPGAIVKGNSKQLGINLLEGVSQFGTAEEQLAQMYNQVEAVLENKFIDAINKVSRFPMPKLAFATGHGEMIGLNTHDALNDLLKEDTLSKHTIAGFFNVGREPFIPETIDALVFLKPTQPFTEADKLKIDQYVMRGGNVFWMIDNMYAEFDSLMRVGNQGFVAFDRQLQLDDLLFNYGARINQNILQDLQADQLPLMNGEPGQTQGDMFSISFMPVLNNGDHIITKNIGNVRALFPNTIDTIKTPGIKKTILLKSSNHAKIIGTPYKIDFSFVQYANDEKQFTVKDTAVAVLLEGKFTSLFKNRMSQANLDTLAKYQRPYKEKAEKAGKMIVVADGDIATNMVVKGEDGRPEPMLMGQNRYTGFTFANKQFYNNSIEYLLGGENILATRNKDYTLRLLDPVKKETDAGLWKFITTAVPLLILVVIGFVFSVIRKRKYVK